MYAFRKTSDNESQVHSHTVFFLQELLSPENPHTVDYFTRVNSLQFPLVHLIEFFHVYMQELLSMYNGQL